MAQKHGLLSQGVCTGDTLVDRAVLSGIQGALAGKARVLVVPTGARLETVEFVRAALGCQVLQVFEGVPEVFGGGFSTLVGDYKDQPEAVGVPFPTLEYKIKGGEGFDADDPRGEILIRGPLVAQTPDIDAAGWLRSGVFGRLLPNGALALLPGPVL
ncbi:Long-chain-fatty-acid--CoA ligase 6 [Cladochytrium tenue]|nr:Long-chain-fatty-acid--CoA ligase 6 [Cladochytrium tenue]